MDRALYISMSGAKENTLAQSVLANNLANLNTDGFHRDFVQARSVPVYAADGHPTRAYALSERPATDFSLGPRRETGRDLDLVVEGQGWIAVQAPDGREALTRLGNLKITALGQLVTGNDLPVLGNDGPIALPPSQKIEIGTDGSISVRALGQTSEALAQVDRIKLVNPPQEMLGKGTDGLITHPGGPLPADASVRVATGFLEGSNVNAVEVMTEIISLARLFEIHVKMMHTIDQNTESASRILQIS